MIAAVLFLIQSNASWQAGNISFLQVNLWSESTLVRVMPFGLANAPAAYMQ